jgi:hypothetical protein
VRRIGHGGRGLVAVLDRVALDAEVPLKVEGFPAIGEVKT